MQAIQHNAFEVMSDSESLLVENRLWWMSGRKAVIKHFVERAKLLGTISTIMDIGCGSGGNLDALAPYGKVIGVEPSETLASRARGRKIAAYIIQQEAQNLDDCKEVDLFTMFDVLEHIKDDTGFLLLLRSKAVRTHRLLLSVPACPFLFSDHDRLLHHCRRYNRATLRATLQAGGYRVIHMNYFMVFLFPLVLLVRMKDKLMAKLGKKSTIVDLCDIPRQLAVLFKLTLKVEAVLSSVVRFPIGLWLFALVESRPETE